MEKKNISSHWNQIVIHKKLGKIKVKEVISNDDGKFVGKVLSSNEEKKFIFSSQFFVIDENDTSYEVKVNKMYKPQRKKERDYRKYRNHPLVKDIEYKENHIRVIKEEPQDETNEDKEVN